MTNSTYLLPYADLSWADDETPYSPYFDDIYWSQNSPGGVQEKQHVFINANRLRQRWEQLTTGNQFTILETGFGFGINFSLTIDLWRSVPSCKNSCLHYVAFEQYPVNPSDIAKLNSQLGDDLLQPLLDKYPLPIPGSHHLWVDDNICLTLVLGDIKNTLPAFSSKIDACFLDGFSPAKNKGMWSAKTLEKISQLMRPGATLSTYSVAGDVRRRLGKAGLTIKKLPGFGKKAEMMRAEKPHLWVPLSKPGKLRVCIIGAGLAGIYCALALKRRGISPVIHEASPAPLGCVSEIDQIGLCPQFSARPQASSLFSFRAFEYFRQHFDYQASGRVQLISNERERKRADLLTQALPESVLSVLPPTEVIGRTGLDLSQDTLLFPTAGWMHPHDVCDNTGLSINYNSPIERVEKTDSEWTLIRDDNEIDRANHVILTTGASPQNWLTPLSLVPVRGQSVRIEAEPSPSMIVAGGVTYFPPFRGMSTVSATYTRDDPENSVRQKDSDDLVRDLNKISPVSISKEASANYNAAVGFRSTTRDRMPVVGQIPNWAALDQYCQLSRRERQKPFDQFEEGLFCAVGFGSHGMTHAPFCGEYLARLINDEPHTLIPELTATRFSFRAAGLKIAIGK